jgi:hypothetical protein
VCIISYKYPDRFLIVPNTEYFFDEVRNRENCLDVIASFSFKDIAEIHLIRLGAVALRFSSNGPLRSIVRLDMEGSGEVPDHVVRNHDDIVELQGRRLVFANFIAGTLFGRISALRHSALSGAQYAGMDEIVGFGRSGPALVIETSEQAAAIISPKMRHAAERPGRIQIVTPEEVREAIEFARHLAEREDQFEQANLQACMVMNYQAAILHNEQHSAGSLALNFAVAEALIKEIFLAYGLVGDRSPRSFATRNHTIAKMSNTQFRRIPLDDKLSTLLAGHLIDHYLHQRLDEGRALRNDLMHSAVAATVRQSGTMQTVVRDLWSYLLDMPFELVSGWSMRL